MSKLPAVEVVPGVRWSPVSFCTNFILTKQTATRLADVDYAVAAFTHSPHVTDDPRTSIRDFLRRRGVRTD